jgi:LuxR family transcriptional regulator, maltose regulon positive regulatory protein
MLGGRYERATRLCQEANSLAHLRGWCGTWPMGITAVTAGAVAFHRDRIGEADGHNQRAVELLKHSGDHPLRAMVVIQRARICGAYDQPELAYEALQVAREWLRGWPIMPAVTGLVTALEASALDAMGDAAGAAALLERDRQTAATTEAAAAAADLHLERGDAAAALATLDPFLHAAATPLESTRTEAWVLAARAHDALADHDAAAKALEHALTAAEVGGLRRPFVRHGSAIGPLLRRQLRNGTSHRALLDDLLVSIEHPMEASFVATLPDSLSDRESAVLRFLPTMMSNQEIASELFVSVNTIKTHLKAIYRKLDVDDRRSAVRRARDLALLGPR